ncbi:MAG: hypothetical protein KGJ90_04450 [Patescibacteria group bacterium]|nr:hypothetical protein [Patescibacteria group bacterium]
MQNPQFSPKEYLASTSLNTAYAQVSGNVGLLASLALEQGSLLYPDYLTLTVSGLVLNISAPAPFSVMFPGGAISQAHGTLGGQDTQSYSVNFSSFVPSGAGTITAYLVASYAQIQQNAIQITGPPPGNPDYDPTFVPYTAYTTLTDTISFSATSGVPTSTTPEICRFSLTSGIVTLPTPNLSNQRRAAVIPARSITQLSANTALTASNAGRELQATAACVLTLPTAASVNGLPFFFTSVTSGAVTIQTNGTDKIFGSGTVPSSGVNSISLSNGGSVEIEAQTNNTGASGIFQIVGGNGFGLNLGSVAYLGLGSGVTSSGNNLITNLASGLKFLGTANAVAMNSLPWFSNLKIITNDNTHLTITADNIVTTDPNGINYPLGAFNRQINFGTTGANGLDTGSVSGNTHYSLWAIYNGTTTAALASLSQTAPSLPSGYTSKVRVGWITTQQSSSALRQQLSYGRVAQFINTGSGMPKAAGGSASLWTSVTVVGSTGNGNAGFVPPTASRIYGTLLEMGGGATVVAANSSYGNTSSSGNPPNAYTLGGGAGNAFNTAQQFVLTLESSNIYWASIGAGAAGGALFISGYEDNL